MLYNRYINRSVIQAITGAVFLLGMMHNSIAQAPNPKIDSFLKQAILRSDKRGWTSVIARIEGDLTGDNKKKLIALHADIVRRLPIISSLTIRVPTKNLKALCNLPFIKHLSADLEVKKNDDVSVERSGAAHHD